MEKKHYAGLIFWNDGPEMLERSLSSVKRNGFKIIAADGVFAEYLRLNGMDGPFKSSNENRDVVMKYADEFIECPDGGWESQVAKRNAILERVPDGAYYWANDADEVFDDFDGFPEMTAPIYRMLEWDVVEGQLRRKYTTIRTYLMSQNVRYARQHCRVYDMTRYKENDLDAGLLVKAHWDNNGTHPMAVDQNGAVITVKHYRMDRPDDRKEQKLKFYLNRAEAKLPYA